jgi:tetratricopeptide (TPR) repeat protein/CHAT domain-containing protein
MLATLLWRATEVIIFVAFLTITQSSTVSAEQSDDIKALRQQIQQLDRAGKYVEALALQRRLAGEIEKAETSSVGKPGTKTADSLISVAWYALLAHNFRTALAASNRAHALVPKDLYIETNRAHALLLLGRVREARSVYLAHKGKPISLTSDAMWEDLIADDMEALAKAGILRTALKQINAELGGKNSVANADLAELNQKIQELDRTGHYQDAQAAAEKYVALVRQRYSEDHPKFATAIHWLGHTLKEQGRYAEAESLYKRALAIDEKALGPEHSGVGTDLSNLALLYRDQVRYAEAEPLYKRALAIDEKALGPEHSGVGTDLNNLALLYHDQGRYAEAEPLYKRALAIAEKALGPDHPDVGRDLNNLALLYRDQGRYAEAEPLYTRALAIGEKALGTEHPDVGTRLNNLAELYYAQGRYAEAEPLYKRALAIDEKALGPDHPDVATRLNNLAELYRAQGRYAEAEPLYTRALANTEKALGADHPRVGVALNNLAGMYGAQGRYAEAEPLYKRALAIAEKALGPDHPDVGRDLNNLAVLYRAQGRYAEAEPLYTRALAIDEKALGPDHPDVGRDLHNLAELYHAQGRYAKAEPLYTRALAIDEKALGPDHPDVGTALDNLAQLYHKQGRYAKAEPLYKRALAIAEKALGTEHPDVGIRLNDLAELYRAQGRYAEAERLYTRALAIAEKARGPDHPDVGTALDNLAQLYVAQGRYVESEPLYKRALAITEKALGPDHPDVGIRLASLAELYHAQGRYADAEPLCTRVLAIAEKALGPDHPDVGTALNNLAGLYHDQGRYAEAEPLYKRALAIDEKALGPDHPDVGRDLNNLAALYFEQSDWASAAKNWRSSTGVIIRRAQRGTLIGEALTGKTKSEAIQRSSQFWGLVKVVHRLASKELDQASSLRETFQTAQWAQSSEAAQSLSEMAARAAKGDPKLAALVRERQDLVAEWQRRDQVRSAAVGQAPDKRNREAEAANLARLTAIDTRIAAIDQELAAKFPDYAVLASPTPLSVEDVQAQLGPDEALVLFLDTPEWKPTPEETFIWVVTKTDARWVRSDLGSPALTGVVAALRCGLDYEGSWTDPHCIDLLKVKYTHADHDVFRKPLPFDLALAHALYEGLFDQIEDLIKYKQLVIVPSGPLTQLPFQVLVTALSNDVPSGDRLREVGRLGIEMQDLTSEERQSLQLPANRGIKIVNVTSNGPAEAAGLKLDDILLSVDGVDFASSPNVTQVIRTHAPGSTVRIRILRDGAEFEVTATLGTNTIREWVPRFLISGEGRNTAWLAREHAITVLPAVSSLKALRQYAKQSHASEAYIGFGDPLLDGEPSIYAGDLSRAKLAREKQCMPTRVALISDPGSGARAATRGTTSSIDVEDIRRQEPLPETADELCDVARDLGVDPARDVYIGAKATETEIKRLSQDGTLAKYKVVHFATHGLVAGDLSSTSEPGLLLTPPDRPSDVDDGYLSASEVAALKLDADWVILSACNTAAGDTKDADALSGLARAFFYAGARSLLVSHWSVNSDATVKLITKAVAELQSNPKIGRAEALRRSILAMIDRGKDDEAHPAFWAPFILVGEGVVAR